MTDADDASCGPLEDAFERARDGNIAPPHAAHSWVRDLGEALEDGLILIDPSGELSFATQRGIELLGYPSLLAIEADWEAVRDFLISELGDLAAFTREGKRRRITLRSSEVHELHVQAFALEEDDCQSTLLFLRDFDEVRRLESSLLLAAQMRHVAQQYSALAHDLKTPLNAIVVTLDVVESVLADEDETRPIEREFLVDQVSTLKREVERLSAELRVVQNLLIVPQDPWDEMDLREQLSDVVDLFQVTARESKLDLRLSLPDEPLVLLGHPDQLRSVFQNLITNAVEALSTGGGSVVEIAASRQGERIVVVVEDDGPGIPEEMRDDVFRLSFSTKTSGSGIGLHIVASTIDLYKGQVEVVPGELGGACFRVELPVRSRGKG